MSDPKRMFLLLFPPVLACLFGLCLVTACSHGSSSHGLPTDVEALTMPESIALTDVDDETASAIYSAEAGYDDAGTDYTNEPKHTWVDDTEALDIVNDILTVVANTGYENFVNQGAYKALVEPVGDSKTSQTGANSTDTTVESLQEITVEVIRTSRSAPMVVKIWLIEEDGPGGKSNLIRGYFNVIEGVSDEYPYGIMEAHFKGVELNSNGVEVNPDEPLFTMAMSIDAEDGNVLVQVVDHGEEEEGPGTFEWNTKANIITNEDFSEGKAYIWMADTDWNPPFDLVEEDIYFAYNEDYFKSFEVGVDAEPVVQSKSDLDHKIFNYKLFEKDTGDKVTLASGFPIFLEEGGHGYIGYWGTWTPFGCELADGDTVTNAMTGDEYTLVKVRGKLTKHTRSSILLSELTDVELSVWNEGSDIIVAWDGTSEFKKLGARDFETGMIEYLETPITYTFENEWSGGWCESLSAWLPLGDLTPDNSDTVYYHEEETVNPTTAQNWEFSYWDFTLDLPITQSVIDNSMDDMNDYWMSGATEKTFYFDADNMVLKETDVLGEEVIMPAGLDLSGTWYDCGYHLGPLVANSTYDETDWWQAWNEEIYYNWNTGPNEWNHFSTVMDGEGEYVVFDAPIRFSYTHSTENDINGNSTNDGKKFNVDYDGHQLCIPWYFDEDADDWAPAFNLRDGVTLVDALTSEEYVVKATEEDLIMQVVDDAGVITELETTLPIDMTIEEPTLEYNASLTAQVGAMPANAELKVIKGELIE
ncbi:MAG: hypothetical protein KJ645_05110 [Planctomycetes bacterium]|nr:hypothetical protein [Planctomycetota bacterium]